MRRIILGICSVVAAVFFAASFTFAGPLTPPVSAPEPVTALLVGAGVAGVATYRFIRGRKK
jgi:hypothetical protein